MTPRGRARGRGLGPIAPRGIALGSSMRGSERELHLKHLGCFECQVPPLPPIKHPGGHIWAQAPPLFKSSSHGSGSRDGRIPGMMASRLPFPSWKANKHPLYPRVTLKSRCCPELSGYEVKVTGLDGGGREDLVGEGSDGGRSDQGLGIAG